FIAANSCTGHLFTVSSPPISTLFPYTTLFRSRDRAIVAHVFDSPGVAVADPVLAVAKAPVVAAGDDRVPDPGGGAVGQLDLAAGDRKSTRLNSSHVSISYAVFCLKKKKTDKDH